MRNECSNQIIYPPPAGFTLIELSIVLVIIGLIVGGVLVGQDLIRAAGVRAQVTQIEKFNTAVNTFRDKYGYLPGDIKDPDASSFGFIARGSAVGEGDGNGLIEGVHLGTPAPNGGNWISVGEGPMVWMDLSAAHLIDGSFTSATPTSLGSLGCCVSGASISQVFPVSKIDAKNYVYVWSGAGTNNGVNYFGLSAVTFLGSSGDLSSATLTVATAQSIDRKVDDGLPKTGNVTAQYLQDPNDGASNWAANAATDSSTTCFNSTTNQYSVSISNGANPNCALSFRFQ